jgi:hypothetical protein
MKEAHSSTPKPVFQCSQCPKVFFKKNNLNIHERIHSGIKPYKCVFCCEAFAQKNSLNVHVRRHGLEIQHKRKVLEGEGGEQGGGGEQAAVSGEEKEVKAETVVTEQPQDWSAAAKSVIITSLLNECKYKRQTF